MSGELLERQRVGEARATGERPRVPQQVEPSEPGGDHGGGGQPPAGGAQHPRRRRTIRLGVLAACLAWLGFGVYGVVAYGHDYWLYRGFAPPHDPPGVRHGRILTERFWSRAMHSERSYLIYLPPGYAAAAARGRRFPVLYLLHGSPGTGWLFVNAGGVGVELDKLVTERRVRPFLIVMPNGSDGTFMTDTEWANTRHGRYESLALEAVRAVDARWPTLRDRRYRALAGNSEGAYAAVNIGLRHLDMFSVAEAWSGYFTQVGFSGPFMDEPRSLVDANSPSFYVPYMAAALHRMPFHAFIYSGRYDRPTRGNAVFARELHYYGGHVTFSVLAAGHTWELWRSQTPRALIYISRSFGSRR